MINKYLISVFKSFSAEDWKKYRNFIKQRDIISGRHYYPLVNLLHGYFKKQVDYGKIYAGKLFEKAYKKKYSERTILNRQSELLMLTKEFLNFLSLEKNKFIKSNLYYRELLERNLLEMFSRDTVTPEKLIDENIYNQELYGDLQERVLLNASFHQHKKEQKRAMELYFRHSRILLADIICNLYRTGQEMLIQKYESIEQEFNPVMDFLSSIIPDNFFKALIKRKDKQYIIPAVRYYLFKSIQNLSDSKYLSDALKIFYKNEINFTEDFRTDIYRTLMTYYIMKVNRGEIKYNNELFLLYKRKLQQNLVSDLKMSGYPANVFREYIVTGLKVRQYKWVEMVIKKYSPLLPVHLRDDEVNLAMIRMCFNRKEYGKALTLINNHKTKNNLHNLDSMRYKLACFFELKRFEEAYFEIDRSKHYLKYNRSRLPEFHRMYFKKFLDKVLKILNYIANPFNKDPEMILFEIESDESNYLMKDWVSRKARELISANKRI